MHRHLSALALTLALTTGCSAGTEAVSTSGPSGVPGLSPAASAVPSPRVRTIDVAYAGGAVTGTDGREEVQLGEQVVLRITSEIDEEYHVHGYDLEGALPAGQPVEVPLTASIPGVFEVELHDAGKLLFQLRVA